MVERLQLLLREGPVTKPPKSDHPERTPSQGERQVHFVPDLDLLAKALHPQLGVTARNDDSPQLVDGTSSEAPARCNSLRQARAVDSTRGRQNELVILFGCRDVQHSHLGLGK